MVSPKNEGHYGKVAPIFRRSADNCRSRYRDCYIADRHGCEQVEEGIMEQAEQTRNKEAHEERYGNEMPPRGGNPMFPDDPDFPVTIAEVLAEELAYGVSRKVP